MDTHSITSVYNQGNSFTATINGHKLTTDSNSEGTAEGPSPKKLMLASLAGCTGIDVASILTKMKVEFSKFSIDVTASLTDSQPQVYKDVMITYHIKINEGDRLKIEKAIKLSEEKYCGVSAMFRAFTNVGHQVDYL